MTAGSTTQETPSQVLRHEGVPAFFAALLSDELATALWVFTLGWVASRASTVTGTGVILLASGLPYALMLVLGGSLTDRLGSARVAVWTLLARVMVMLGWWWAALEGHASSGTLIVGAVLVGAIAGVHQPAMTSYPVQLVPDEGQASSMVIERGLARFAQGGAGFAAGLLTEHWGVGGPAAVAAALLILALAVVAVLGRGLPSVSAATAVPSEKVLSHLVGGLRWVGDRPILRRTLAVQSAVSALVGSLLLVLLPLRARAAGWTPASYGWAFGAFGVGMLFGVLGALWAAERRGGVGVYGSVVLALGGCLSVAALGVAQSAAWTATLAGAAGLLFGPVGPTLSGYLRGVARADADAAVSGRAMAVLLLMTDAVEPLVLFIAAAIVAAISVDQAALLLGGLAALACVWAGSGLRGLR